MNDALAPFFIEDLLILHAVSDVSEVRNGRYLPVKKDFLVYYLNHKLFFIFILVFFNIIHLLGCLVVFAVFQLGLDLLGEGVWFLRVL